MKPYGQKPQKSKSGVHSSDKCNFQSCNTGEWKILKKRERKHFNVLDQSLNNIHIMDLSDVWANSKKDDEWIGWCENFYVTANNEVECIIKLENLEIKN